MRPFAPGRVMVAGGHPVIWAGIFFLLVAVAVVIGAVLVTRLVVNRPGRQPTEALPAARPQPDGAVRILEERFARGEIDEDEFRRRRDVLRG